MSCGECSYIVGHAEDCVWNTTVEDLAQARRELERLRLEFEDLASRLDSLAEDADRGAMNAFKHGAIMIRAILEDYLT